MFHLHLLDLIKRGEHPLMSPLEVLLLRVDGGQNFHDVVFHAVRVRVERAERMQVVEHLVDALSRDQAHLEAVGVQGQFVSLRKRPRH